MCNWEMLPGPCTMLHMAYSPTPPMDDKAAVASLEAFVLVNDDRKSNCTSTQGCR